MLAPHGGVPPAGAVAAPMEEAAVCCLRPGEGVPEPEQIEATALGRKASGGGDTDATAPCDAPPCRPPRPSGVGGVEGMTTRPADALSWSGAAPRKLASADIVRFGSDELLLSLPPPLPPLPPALAASPPPPPLLTL